MNYTELDKLKSRITGSSVIQEMRLLGINIDELGRRVNVEPTLFPTGNDAKNLIDMAVEIHIEQGRYSAKSECNVAVVSAIRGNVRFRQSEIHGKSDHSGAAFEEDRADALLTYAELMVAAKSWCEEKRKGGRDVVFTPATVECSNKSPTTISDNVKFTFEIRSTEENLLKEFAAFMQKKQQEILDINTSGNLRIDLGKFTIEKPAIMDKDLIDHALEVARRLGVVAKSVNSGAGHDSSKLATAGVPSVMLFVRQDDPLSHNPAESRREDSFLNTIRILLGMITKPRERQIDTNTGSPRKTFLEYIQAQGAQPYTLSRS